MTCKVLGNVEGWPEAGIIAAALETASKVLLRFQGTQEGLVIISMTSASERQRRHHMITEYSSSRLDLGSTEFECKIVHKNE